MGDTNNNPRSRSWCLTISNYTEDDIARVKGLKYKYIIIGDEIAPETETPHLQIYVNMKDATPFKTLKKKVPRAHIEVAKGNAEQNKIYCSKEKVLYEDGDLPKQGKRTDISTIKECIENGANMEECLDQIHNFQGIRIAETLMKYKERKRNKKPIVKWYYGPTGTGKSKRAWEEMPDAYSAMASSKWWEGYDADKQVIIDDFRADFCKYNELLKLLDRYPHRIECKGGSRQFLAEEIIITSCHHPEVAYNTREDIGQLLRRIDVIEEIS